jgi:hypothetical protein
MLIKYMLLIYIEFLFYEKINIVSMGAGSFSNGFAPGKIHIVRL